MNPAQKLVGEANLNCRPQNCVCVDWGATEPGSTLVRVLTLLENAAVGAQPEVGCPGWGRRAASGRVRAERSPRGLSCPPPSVWILHLCLFIFKCVYRCVGFLKGCEGREANVAVRNVLSHSHRDPEENGWLFPACQDGPSVWHVSSGRAPGLCKHRCGPRPGTPCGLSGLAA